MPDPVLPSQPMTRRHRELDTRHGDARATRQLLRYLIALAGREPPGGLIEVRYRDPHRPARMRSSFHPGHAPADAAGEILMLGATTDVYVGVAPRRRRAGGKDAIERAWALWADLDTPDALRRLKDLPVAPGILVASGSAGHLHAYWLLRDALSVPHVERGNRRLAIALGADAGAVVNAATILRPPGTHSFKSGPPVPVTVQHFKSTRLRADAVLSGLPEPPDEPAAGAGRTPQSTRGREDDPLLEIAPVVYVAALTGQPVGHDHKISCPFHEDSDPSLHAYPQPARGWTCYGCRRGGTVYDLAAELWGLGTRRRDFIELRRRLYELLLPGRQPPSAPSAKRAGGS